MGNRAGTASSRVIRVLSLVARFVLLKAAIVHDRASPLATLPSGAMRWHTENGGASWSRNSRHLVLTRPMKRIKHRAG